MKRFNLAAGSYSLRPLILFSFTLLLVLPVSADDDDGDKRSERKPAQRGANGSFFDESEINKSFFDGGGSGERSQGTRSTGSQEVNRTQPAKPEVTSPTPAVPSTPKPKVNRPASQLPGGLSQGQAADEMLHRSESVIGKLQGILKVQEGQGSRAQAPTPSTIVPETVREKPENNEIKKLRESLRETAPIPSAAIGTPAAPGNGVPPSGASSSFDFSQTGSQVAAEKSAPTLSLIVNATPHATLEKVLGDLFELQRKQKVQIGEIVIVGRSQLVQLEKDYTLARLGVRQLELPRTKEEYEKQKKATARQRSEIPPGSARRTPTEVTKALLAAQFYSSGLQRKYHLEPDDTVEVDELTERLHATVSPTWIVHDQDTDHVFQGGEDVSRLFTFEGKFRAPEVEAQRFPSPDTPSQASRSRGENVSLVDSSSAVLLYPKQVAGRPLPKLPNSRSETVFSLRE